MNNRQIKKLQNRYITDRDFQLRTKKIEQMSKDISKNVENHLNEIQKRDVFYSNDFSDNVLTNYLLNNIDKISYNRKYFSTLFNQSTISLERHIFLELDDKLSKIKNIEEFYNILLTETNFKLDWFENIKNSSANNLEIKFTLNYNNLIELEADGTEIEQLTEILGFDFEWFNDPLVILNRYKRGKGRENIDYVVTYLSFFFDTPLEYEEEPKKYINVADSVSKKRKRKKYRKIPVKNWEELYNKRYLFASIDNKFYKFIEEYTTEILIDSEYITFKVDNPYFTEIIFYK